MNKRFNLAKPSYSVRQNRQKTNSLSSNSTHWVTSQHNGSTKFTQWDSAQIYRFRIVFTPSNIKTTHQSAQLHLKCLILSDNPPLNIYPLRLPHANTNFTFSSYVRLARVERFHNAKLYHTSSASDFFA